MTKPSEARFVWYDRCGTGRDLYGMFRKSFRLDKTPRRATLHVFADTHYLLFVNGEFVEYGPVRCDPRFPLFDTHDLTARLRAGHNVIAILVNFFGMKTFKAIPVRAGLVAWGSIETSSETISLETKTGSWRCRPSAAHFYAPKLSFALNAAERYDQSKAEEGWTTPEFDDSAWQECVELDDQSGWGPLAPRNIPFMTGAPVPIVSVRHVLPLMHGEDWYSFSVPAPSQGDIHAAREPEYVAFQTYIYSPRDQVIHAGVFWGETWLNGQVLPKGTECVNKPMRYSQPWHLRAGWNHYGGFVRLYQDILDQYIALPSDRGLVVSAVKDPSSDIVWRRSEIFPQSLFQPPQPMDENEALEKVGGWIPVRRHECAHSPCRETSWDTYGEPVERLSPEHLAGHVFRASDYPHGFSLLLDIDHMHLAFPILRLSGVSGSVIDLTYGEHLMPDHMHLRHSHNYGAGDRILCSRDTIEFMPCHPRGMRYLMLTLRRTRGDVRLDDLRLRAARYPVQNRGRFRCSDPTLSAVWEMGKRTQAANMEDAYVDCSGRERGMYLRDTILQYHTNLAAFGDHALMHRCLQLYGQSPDETGKFRAVYPNTGDYTISDFALNALEGYRVYWEHTGDLKRIREDWGAMKRNLAWFHALADERPDMLLDAEWDKHHGIRAHYGGFHGDLGALPGHMAITGIHFVFSATYLIAMQSALVLAQALGEHSDAAHLRKRIAVLRRSLQKFWDPRRKKFADNLERTTHSVHAALFAVRAGIATKAQLAAIRTYVAHELRSLFVNGYSPDDGAYTSPNYAFYILDGLYRAGLPGTAENLMRMGWGWALAQGMRTCPEYWSHQSSLCHAWSSTPTYFLSRYVLGVHYPTPPDLTRVAICVCAESISSAEGAFPHPRGAIEVAWHLEKSRRVFDRVKAPRGVRIVSVR